MNRTVSIPAALLPALQAAEAHYRENGGSPEHPPAEAAQSLARVWAVSRFVAENCARDPSLLAELASSGELAAAASPAARVKKELQEIQDERALMTRLRRVRRRELTRIAWRDLAGSADLDETLRDLSELADACIQGALTHLSRRHAERHGTARGPKGAAQSLVVLGLGKLDRKSVV